ncbi:hypothetical protein PH5382_00630 [Phaeobacter sp. CECT 5382]|uniref:LPS assembly lipoprotein LptE n=1 Tax=Rhodobacterales TaxID=204455 RepID=UPI0006DBD6B9|nr:LPS assembly lipoprotein LptE [Phaeobacter sp. CECT 5382]CUH86717.1 hypothetical protein PH5382_00630 [Phaeobacter sp. CECT 5382]
MSLLNRSLRRLCLTASVVVGTFTLGVISGCGFTPVYAPGGGGTALYGQVSIQVPEQVDSTGESNAYFLVRDLEERLGRNSSGDYDLGLTLATRQEGQAITAGNDITRYSIIGKAGYSLTRLSDGVIVSSGTETNFTGYSATGSTVETLAGERDAYERLMGILADQITSRILATADLAVAPVTTAPVE